MKLFFSFVFALLAFTACTKPEKEVYIFTSHREPALDGLHYLYSYDGYHWDSIAGSWLKRKHSKKCTFYTLRFGCSFAAVNTIKPQLL